MPYIRQPPSDLTGALRQYLDEVAKAVNAMPNFSYFTQNSPNGVLFGNPGDRAIYVGSTSTLSREWVKASAPGTISNQSWVQVRIIG